MQKINHKNELKHLYKPSAKKIEVVDVPAMNYLMIDGKGDPNTSKTFSSAIEVLFSGAYTLKFKIKKSSLAIDYSVMPLEGLWWADNMEDFSAGIKENWQWTLMIMQPEFISPQMVRETMEDIKNKKNPAALPLLRFESFKEGSAAQTMHIGPFAEEGPTIKKVHKYIKEMGREICGRHHEIYLSDMRRASPEKWKTVIRQPMR